jgi:hypothetical protein
MNAVAKSTEAALRAAGLKIVARVQEAEGVMDLAVMVLERRLAIVRCMARHARADHEALVQMIADGDCVWVGLVCEHSTHLQLAPAVHIFDASNLSKLTVALKSLTDLDPTEH